MRLREEDASELPVLIVDGAVHLCQRQRPDLELKITVASGGVNAELSSLPIFI